MKKQVTDIYTRPTLKEQLEKLNLFGKREKEFKDDSDSA